VLGCHVRLLRSASAVVADSWQPSENAEFVGLLSMVPLLEKVEAVEEASGVIVGLA